MSIFPDSISALVEFVFVEGAKCPKNHGLKRFQTSHGNYRCDECGKKFRRGTTMNGCKECNFDLCIDCSDVMVTHIIYFLPGAILSEGRLSSSASRD